MSAVRLVASVCLIAFLNGCGLSVPEIQENPFASEKERSDFIQAIVRNVRCEVQDAVVNLYAEDPPSIDPFNRNLGWFDSWAVQISLTLTTDEKGTISPVATLMAAHPTSYVFTFGLGATQSEEAQRINKIGSFFTVRELKKLNACPPGDRNRGPFILEGNLKLYEWLKATMISIDNGDTPPPTNPNGPFKTNVLSHEVKFDIISTSTLNPGWKLTTATVNQSGNLLSGTRDRTQDLIVTFGPLDPSWLTVALDGKNKKAKVRPAMLSPAAANAAFSSELSSDIANAVSRLLKKAPASL